MSKPDSIDRLIDYTETIKPYRTKIVEVLTNYTHEDEAITKVVDSLDSAEIPCVCEPELVGWDTQPFAVYEGEATGKLDARGNPVYEVEESVDNGMYDAPRTPPPLPDPEECCTGCELMLHENLGWDTQPFSLYEAEPDASVGGKYNTVPNPFNVAFDSPMTFEELQELQELQ